MSLATGLDYSAGTIPGHVIKAAGHSFVIRYCDDPHYGLSRKHIRPAEYRDLTGAGVDVYLVFEIGTDDMLGGFKAGAMNASGARAGADWVGYPPSGLIFMACDRHLTDAQIPTALAYLDGAASVLGNDAVGCYGFWELTDAAAKAGKGVAFWQCGIAPNATDPIHIWQQPPPGGSITVGGVPCDLNHLLRPLPQGASDLDATQAAQLTNIENLCKWMYQQHAGPGTSYPNVTGWQTWGGGTGEHLTILDLLRRSNVETRQAWDTAKQVLAQLTATPTTGSNGEGTAALSDADVNRIASAVADLLAQRLTQAPAPANDRE
jgi:hypothetical protein